MTNVTIPDTMTDTISDPITETKTELILDNMSDQNCDVSALSYGYIQSITCVTLSSFPILQNIARAAKKYIELDIMKL